MKPSRATVVHARALGLAVALLLATGCTALDDYENFPGTPFTPEQPEAEVTVIGVIHIDPITVSSTGCAPGGTVFWGQAGNSGDVDVTDVKIAIDALNSAGGLIGTYGGSVFNGDIDDTNPDNPFAGTSLEVDQTGTFNVCTPVPFGAASSAEYRTSFVIVEEAI